MSLDQGDDVVQNNVDEMWQKVEMTSQHQKVEMTSQNGWAEPHSTSKNFWWKILWMKLIISWSSADGGRDNVDTDSSWIWWKLILEIRWMSDIKIFLLVAKNFAWSDPLLRYISTASLSRDHVVRRTLEVGWRWELVKDQRILL